MASKQIALPENIYNINNLFEKKYLNDNDNPFKIYKKIYNLDLYIAKNINNLNYYYIDFPFNKKINPQFIIKYLKNIDYRNAFSHESINFNIIKKTSENVWSEEEIYKGHKTIYNVLMTTFKLYFYNNSNDFNTNVSQAKFYMSYKIFNNQNNYVLRFELVLNNMDLDQDIDINIYANMIFHLLKAIHKKFKLENELENKSLVIDPPKEIINNNVVKPWWDFFSCCTGRKEKL